jgi:putative addiction module killer protein
VAYGLHMVDIVKSGRFDAWLRSLRDVRARARVQVRIDRLGAANPGDVRPVGEAVSEMRIDYGPGYRVYFTTRGNRLVIVLAGGDKSTQAGDIAFAKVIAKEFED